MTSELVAETSFDKAVASPATAATDKISELVAEISELNPTSSVEILASRELTSELVAEISDEIPALTKDSVAET